MSKIDIKTTQTRPARQPIAPIDRLSSFSDVISDESDERTYMNVPVRIANPLRTPPDRSLPIDMLDVSIEIENIVVEQSQEEVQEEVDEG